MFLLWFLPLHTLPSSWASPPSNNFSNTQCKCYFLWAASPDSSRGSQRASFLVHSYCIVLKYFWLCPGLPQPATPTKTGSYLKTRAAFEQSYNLAHGRPSRVDGYMCLVHFPLWPLLLIWATSCCVSSFDFLTLQDLTKILILSVFFPSLGFWWRVLHQWCEW